jgi:hypothetical protein
MSATQPPARPVAPVTPLEALGLSILAELVGLRADLAAKNSPHGEVLSASLSRADLARLGKMLPAIAGAHGSRPRSSRDLAEDDAPAVRLVVRGLSAKAMSKLFTRAEGVAIDGLMVRRAGTEFRVALWQVVAVPGSFKLPETLHRSRTSSSIDAGDSDA